MIDHRQAIIYDLSLCGAADSLSLAKTACGLAWRARDISVARVVSGIGMEAGTSMSNDAVGLVGRDNLMARVFQDLRLALMEGRFRPGHRFKIRELAETM